MNRVMDANTNTAVLISLDNFKIMVFNGAKIMYYLIASFTSMLFPSLNAIIKAES
jgi:hypothetical protein